ncbi:myrcene synthase protein [Artemisia annua]|uniref:Myrcene synthase protein n=1 Tax=Artemisia annua TaxID=35608 RepID=A0A2U1MQY7_ARTAN|nr:myrcene synthase protein [Artemisia annua]
MVTNKAQINASTKAAKLSSSPIKAEMLGQIYSWPGARVKVVETLVENPLATLELFDDLQRLGLSYHFKDEISTVLEMIYICHYEAHEKWIRLDLNLKALGFRLLRQYGYHIPQGEKLEKKDTVNRSMSMLVSDVLELPLLWRVQRFEAMWFLEAYKRRTDMKPFLLELAELDFNIVQGIHLEDLYSSRQKVLNLYAMWWDGLRWNRKLGFARDRLVGSFMWAVGANYEPPFGVLRTHVSKLISLVNVIDDVYGTLEELEQFTVVKRWDINAVEELPDYMKICFLGFHNTINEMAYDTLTTQKSPWTDYCEANLLEAQWFNGGYNPTLAEFLSNSFSSAYFLDSNTTIGESLQNVSHWSAMILHLADYLGTSSAELERGDIPKSIQCYMHETGTCEEEARAYIKSLIMEAWKKINEEKNGS